MSDLFASQFRNWQNRKNRMGDGAVGRVDESYCEQGERIARHLNLALDCAFYEHGLDFGCGWGRFSGLVGCHCGHLWVADLFDDWVQRAANMIPTSTPVVLRKQRLPLDDGSMTLVIDIMTLQSIDNDALAREAMHELRRVTRRGATVLSLHVVKPRAPTRTPAKLASHLGLSKWKSLECTDIDRAGDTYSLIVGTRI